MLFRRRLFIPIDLVQHGMHAELGHQARADGFPLLTAAAFRRIDWIDSEDGMMSRLAVHRVHLPEDRHDVGIGEREAEEYDRPHRKHREQLPNRAVGAHVALHVVALTEMIDAGSFHLPWRYTR